jgi:protein RecA
MQRKQPKLSDQVKRKASTPTRKKPKYDGNIGTIISTGSTLLDLAISGGRVRGGGIPSGIFVEIFGPNQSGKSVLLSEIAGAVKRRGGEVQFHDPEARLNAIFAELFDLNVKEIELTQPDTVTEVFEAVRKWKPKSQKVVNGIFADSLAALSTQLEMGAEEGDKMGMRRPKEFSEQLRRTCRELPKKNYLMVCSNQIRDNVGGGDWGPRYKTPGGKALEHYPSLRLQTKILSKIKPKRKIAKKEETRVTGIEIQVEVIKSSVWKPHRKAPLTIIFDYGIDDIGENLRFLKDFTGSSTYILGGSVLAKNRRDSTRIIEDANAEGELREAVIDLWEEIEEKFDSDRKPKQR